MANYRILNLVNGNGDVWHLTDKSIKTFATNLTGFGASREISTLRLGSEQQITSSQYILQDLNYTILFHDSTNVDKYQKYNSFIRFLSYKPLYQQYIIPSDKKVYRRKVEVLSIEKTEVNFENHCLECPITFATLGFWEDDTSNYIETGNTIDVGKMYPLVRPYAYGNISLSNIVINTNGLLDTPLEITINGTTTDPRYNIYDENDNIYGSGKFIGTFDKVYVNADETNQEIVLERNGAILDNPYSYQDLTIGSPNEVYITFLKLKQGNSRISFVLDQGFDGTVKLEWRNRYVSI